MLEWLWGNKEWVFSGIGVTALAAIVGIIRFLFSGKRKEAALKGVNQNQRSGMFSKNTQVGKISLNRKE